MEILSKKKTTLSKRNLSPKTCRDWSSFSALQISAQKQQTFQIVFIIHGNSPKEKTTLSKRNLSPKTCRDWSLFSALQFSAQKQQTIQIVFIKHGNSLKEKNNSFKTQFESQDMSRLELVFSSPIFGAEATNNLNCFYKTWKFSQRKKQLFQNAM